MERPSICDGNKYTISSSNTIGLPVASPNLPKEIEVIGNRLLLKSTFHVSLVCINEIVKKHNIINSNFRDAVLDDFCDFVKKSPVEFIRYTQNFSYCEQDKLKTLVAFCEVSNLNNFFEFINKKYELSIEYPPTHVTLYALDGKTGIFLTDTQDLRNFTKSVPSPFSYSL